jgi:uncharacterized protein YfkK (UPF0435 family)
MEPMLSKCGYRCDLCPAHESNLKSEADKKMMCDAWNKYLGGNIEPEVISVCGGCQAEGKQGDESCPVRPCALGRCVETCGHCEDFDCEKVKQKMDFVTQSVKDPDNIDKDDYERYIKPFLGRENLEKIRKSTGS